MIFNFFKLCKIAKFLPIIIISCVLFYKAINIAFPVYAQAVAQNLDQPDDQSFSNQTDHFLQSLIKATQDKCIRIFGEYSTIIAEHADFKKLYFVSYEEVANLLDQAVDESIDSLTLFTLPQLQDHKSFAIVFDGELLEQVQKNYNFHAIFNISAASLEDGSVVKMKFLVIGQGKLIVGYNRNAKIKQSH